jgi:gliding motility-associated-like protein
MLYWTDPSAGLVKYDPYTNTKVNLGLINATPAGDMIFYKDKLMLAAADGYIYEINMADPFHSTRYFSTGTVTFYGLVSVPSSCSTNKYYGLQFVGSQTVLHELDMENKLIVGPVCNLPFLSYDAASNVDNGSTVGIKIDSIISKPVCGNNNVTDITIAVTNLSAGPLIFQLDGTNINSTGIFNSIPLGIHNIKITNTGACITDSTFIVTQSLSTQLNISVANPVYCDLAIGNITVKAPTNSMPLTYSLNGGPYTNNPVFNNLKVGRYTLSIMDGSQCRKDTVITLSCDPLACNGLNIPTGFTPDNNGKNDLFVPYPCKDITGYELRIYNRWGQLVFATTEKNKGWDGTRNKIPQPGGIYIWMINYSTLTDPTKKVLKGTVALIR